MIKRFDLFPVAALVAIVAVGTACSNDESDDKADEIDPIPTDLVTLADLAQGTAPKELTRGEAVEQIKDQEEFFDQRPEEEEEEESELEKRQQACFDEVYSTAKVKSAKERASITVDWDLSKCWGQEYVTDANLKAVSLVLKGSFQVSCKGADLLALNGKSFLELAATNPNPFAAACRTADTWDSISVTRLQSSSTITSEGQDIERESLTVDANATADLKPCTRKKSATDGQWQLDAGCAYISKQRTIKSRTAGTADENEGKEDWTKIEFNNLVGKTTGASPWFESGSASFNINGWTGAVTYAGATTPPAFTLEKDGQKTDHTFDPIASSLAGFANLSRGQDDKSADATREMAALHRQIMSRLRAMTRMFNGL